MEIERTDMIISIKSSLVHGNREPDEITKIGAGHKAETLDLESLSFVLNEK
jgi:hypothetical protein